MTSAGNQRGQAQRNYFAVYSMCAEMSEPFMRALRERFARAGGRARGAVSA